MSGSSNATINVSVYKPDATTLIANIPKKRGAKFQNEINAPGSASFDLPLDNFLVNDHPDLLDYFNVVKFKLNGIVVKSWIVEGIDITRVGQGGPADRWVTLSGRGPECGLEVAVVYPENGLRGDSPEDRLYNFTSADGAWLNPPDWATPVGVAWSADTAPVRAGNPKAWASVDPDAQWLWSVDPTSTPIPPGPNWFRATITLTDVTNVIVYASADNRFVGYMDGELIVYDYDNFAWTRVQQHTMTLGPGNHTFSVRAVNAELVSATNTAGFIGSIWQAAADGTKTNTNIWRSTPSSMTVKAYGAAPGWSGAAILIQSVQEAQDRGVTALEPVTFDFTGATDSDGNTWDDIQDRVVSVSTDLSDLATQVVELSLDMEIDGNFVMHAWKKRGTDLSSTLALRPTRDLTSATSTSDASRIRNQALLKYDGGWMEMFSAVSKSLYGRREVGLSVGTANSTDQTKLAGEAALRESVSPETTIPVAYTSTTGPQPFSDYNLGDTLMVPDRVQGMTKGRVMSITGAQTSDAAMIDWDIDFYPDTDDSAITTTVIATGGNYNSSGDLYEHEVLSDSPWAYWRQQEASGTTLADMSGFQRPLTLVGSPGPTLAQAGPFDKAVAYDLTVGQYAVTGVGVTYDDSDTTLEAWVYITQLPTDKSNVIGMAAAYGGTTNHDKELGIGSTGHFYFRVFNGAEQLLVSTATLSLNTWYHIVGSVGAAGQRVYLNGALDNHSDAVKTSDTTAGKRVFIRGGASGYNNTDRVVIAEPAVYFDQLTDTRVKVHHDALAYVPPAA